MKYVLSIVLAVLITLTVSGCSSKSNGGTSNNYTRQNASGNESVSNNSSVRVKLTVSNEEVIVKLYDNPTSRDFLTLLPLTIKIEDYAWTEKISYLPKKLSAQDAPAGSDPSVGDFTYYAPWGNLAIFYKDFGYSDGLIILGKVESGIEKLVNISSNASITIEKMN